MAAILLTLRRWLVWLFEETPCTHSFGPGDECQDCLEARTWT